MKYNTTSRIEKVILFLSLTLFFSCDEYQKGGNQLIPHFELNPREVLTLAPSDKNTRNSEGDFIKLNNGELMFVYTHYYAGTGADHDPAFLVSRISKDDGETWSKEDKIVLRNEGDQNIMSVSLLRLQNGTIALFYLRKNSLQDCIPMMRISKNEGKTWGDAIMCIEDKKGYFTLNNDRVIQLESGRLLLPVANFENSDEVFNPKGVLYCYYSDDNGSSWASSQKVPNLSNILVQEPGLIEMKDGRIMMFSRSNSGKQQVSYSYNQGITWEGLKNSNIISPLSPATIEKDPNSDNWIMVWNNNNGKDPNIKGKRTPLTIAISRDEGKTWEIIDNLEVDIDGWYCYTSVYFVNNESIILSYSSGKLSNNTGLSFTTLKKLNKVWLNHR